MVLYVPLCRLTLIAFGFSLETAKKYKNKYGVKQIERNIAYTLAKQQNGLVKDVPSYLNKAIKEDMGGAWEITQTKLKQDQAERQVQASRREEQSEFAHLKKLSEMSGVPLDKLVAKPAAKLAR